MRNKQVKRIMTFVMMMVVILSATTIAYGSHVETRVLTIGAPSLSATASTELNVTLSHLSYTTEPPTFMVNAGNYAQNATYTKGSQWVTNATYQIFQHDANNTGSTASALNYYMKGDLKGATEYFADAKIGLNGTGQTQIIFGANAHTGIFTPANMPSGAGGQTAANKTIAKTIGIDFNATASGSTYTYNATAFYYYLATSGYVVNYTHFSLGPSATASNSSLQALQMYEVQVNMQNGQQQISIVYTNNGSVIQATPILGPSTYNTNATRTPYLNFSALTNVSMVFSPTASKSGGFLFDWMYVVDTNSIKYNAISSTASPSIAFSGANIIAPPFDPASLTGTSAFQGANASNTASQATVSNGLVSTVGNVTNNTGIQNAIGMNKSLTTGYASDLSGSNMVANSVYSNVSNMSSSVNEQASTWNGKYVTSVLTNFLKSYAANKASTENKVYVSSKDITLISYRIGSMFMDTNYSSGAVTAIRDYIANTYASVFAANNMSVVNPTTGAIVAGAGAGAFYVGGMAVRATISNGMIISPINGHKYTIQSAGFYSGAYISGGAVIVPQYTLLGWTGGTPLFAMTSGFGFGSIFSTLTSGGNAIASLAAAASGTVTNGIGKVASTVDNNIVKPLNSGPIQSAVSSDIANTISSATGITGLINGNVQGAISAGNALSSGTVNSIKGTLNSVGSSAATDILAGYHGFKTGIYSIGGSVNGAVAGIGNGLNGVKNAIANTAGHVSSVSTGALSTVYTKMSNYISGGGANMYSSIKGADNTTLNTLNAIGTTFTKTGSKITSGFAAASNAIGNLANGITSSSSGFFSFMNGLPSMITHVLVYIVVGAVVVVGIIIAVMFLSRRTEGKAIGKIIS